MIKTDIRATLEAIAAGKDPRLSELLAKNIVDPLLVKGRQKEFRAWERFAASGKRDGGEPLAAPSEVLTPLP